MTFLSPGWLALGAAAALAVVALHLLNRERLRVAPLPTARFVPEVPVRSVSSAWRPTDIALMLLRITIVGLVALALAHPAAPPSRRDAVILLVDRSPASDSAVMADYLGRLDTRPDTIIPFQSLSAGLIEARRAGVRLARSADSITLIALSPLRKGLWDAATTAIRNSWPGRMQLVPTGGRTGGRAGVTLEASQEHPVRAAIARLGTRANGGPVRLVWPSSTETTDTASAVYAAGAALVGRFPKLPSVRPTDGQTGGKAVAWFADGSPAVMEFATSGGCDRVVGFAPDAGDGLIRSAGLRIVERLIASCGAGWTPENYRAADSAVVADLAGRGPLASAKTLGPDTQTPLPMLPLVLALIALGGERLLRRRTA